MADARRKLALWRYDYNNVRSHSSLGGMTSAEARRALEESEGPAPGALAQPGTDHYWPRHAALELGEDDPWSDMPIQYGHWLRLRSKGMFGGRAGDSDTENLGALSRFAATTPRG